MKLQCASCHKTVAASSRAEDNNLPDRQTCLPCHKSVRIKAPRSLTVAKFNHQLHLKLGNVAPVIAAAIDKGVYLDKGGQAIRPFLNTANPCEACHRGLEQSDSVSLAAFPRMADCLVCHNKIDPPDSCVKCHVPGPHLKPANHAPDFLDTHTRAKSGLDKSGCAVCHGRKFTCLGCH